MARTTHELWLEDRQGVVDRRRDRVWWRCMHWCCSLGLLLAVPAENYDALIVALRREATPAVATVGRLVAGEPGVIHVRRGR